MLKNTVLYFILQKYSSFLHFLVEPRTIYFRCYSFLFKILYIMAIIGVFIATICLINSAESYTFGQMMRSYTLKLSDSGSAVPEFDEATRNRIEDVIKNNKVVLFMKGNKLFPQCGFSNTACRILDALGAPYETVNVLEDEKIRSGIKVCGGF